MNGKPPSRKTSRLPEGESAAPDPFSVLSIGALSRATGVPVETLRTWERRYGFPAPVDRSGTAHRRYPVNAAARLKLVVQGLAAGHKPSVLLRATPATLRQLLAVSGGVVPRSPPPPHAGRGSFVERCIAHVVSLDAEGLVMELERAWNEVGALEFLDAHLGPFLVTLGERWSEGAVEVGHEHFASEHTREFLNARWRAMVQRARGPLVLCATPSAEAHVLGLHMAATALALAGARLTFLGANTPPEAIVRAAKQQEAAAVALSAAAGIDRALLGREVRSLARALSPETAIIVGGAGFQEAHRGITVIHDLRKIDSWVRSIEGERQSL